MVEIPLRKSQLKAKVDETDFQRPEIGRKQWRVQKSKDNKMFYAVRAEGRKTFYLHRLVLKITDTQTKIDHRNRDGLDCQKINLRIATTSQNAANGSWKKPGSLSKYQGVSFDRRSGCWRTEICKDRQRQHLGYYSLEEDAAKAYDEAARRLHGEFAILNFP